MILRIQRQQPSDIVNHVCYHPHHISAVGTSNDTRTTMNLMSIQNILKLKNYGISFLKMYQHFAVVYKL